MCTDTLSDLCRKLEVARIERSTPLAVVLWRLQSPRSSLQTVPRMRVKCRAAVSGDLQGTFRGRARDGQVKSTCSCLCYIFVL